MKLIAVTNDRIKSDKLAQTIIAIEPYIDAIIVREKTKSDVEVYNLINSLLRSGVKQSKIIVHGRADIALRCGIKKVQLPGHGSPLQPLKEKFPSLSFGRSVHAYGEAEIALNTGVSWLLYGHIFDTGSKVGLPARGTSELLRIVKSLAVPVYVIGGIHPKHLPELQRIGIAGVAIMSSVFGSDDPVKSIKTYREALLHDHTI